MKLKTILIVSYGAVIVSLAALLSSVHVHNLIVNTRNDIESAFACERKLVEHNLSVATQVLQPFSEEAFRERTRSAAKTLSWMLRDSGDSPFRTIQETTELRDWVTRPIVSNEQAIGYMALFSLEDRQYLTPNPCKIPLVEVEKRFPALARILKDAETHEETDGYSEFFDIDGERVRKKFLTLCRVPGTSLHLASTVYIDDFMHPVTEKIREGQDRALDLLKDEIEDGFDGTLRSALLFGLGAVVLSSLTTLFLSFWLAHRIADPIARLKERVIVLGKGDFRQKVEESGSSETIALAQCFNELGEKLTRHIEELKAEIGVRQAIESEIRLVARIQASTLPRMTTEFQNGNFSLDARLVPAKEAAGDFYDFFFLPDRRIALIIADVAGKGLTAAFFMTESKTLVNAFCRQHPDNPAKALAEANRILSENNTECMFVTLFVCYIDPDTGSIVYANAGHHDAIIISANDGIRKFGAFREPPLGFLPGIEYRSGTDTIRPGETLFLYTDGVHEAVGRDGTFYGEERLDKHLLQNATVAVDEMGQRIVDDVIAFEGGARSDDVTTLTFRRIALP